MDGSAELLQLAHLLRKGADAARDIASLRPDDGEAIGRLASQADTIAAELVAIVGKAGAQDGRG